MDASREMELRGMKEAALREAEGGVQVRMETVHHRLSNLDDALDVLGEQLRVVLREPDVRPETPGLVRTPPASELSAFLSDTADRLERVVNRVQELTQRVDL